MQEELKMVQSRTCTDSQPPENQDQTDPTLKESCTDESSERTGTGNEQRSLDGQTSLELRSSSYKNGECSGHETPDGALHAVLETDQVLTPSELAVNSEIFNDKVLEQLSLQSHNAQTFISSVRCFEKTNVLCYLSNVLYSSEDDEWFILVNEHTQLDNAQLRDGSLTVGLGSLTDHNRHQITIATLPTEALVANFPVTVIHDTTLMFRRFLPDNVMHVFHDDILPMFNTLGLIQPLHSVSDMTPFNVSIFLYEDNETLDGDQLYSIFSSRRMLFKNDFKGKGLICFKSLYIGLTSKTRWYDYGYTRPQGPLKDANVQASHIRNTVEYINNHLLPFSENLMRSDYVVLFSRKENRRIANEVNLTLQIIKETGYKVVTLDFEAFSVSDIVRYVQHAKGVVGMHGSLLIFSLFLRPGSFIIELFPFAVSPEQYTPYKTLAEIPGLNLVYKSWENPDKASSQGFPNRDPAEGGLGHLSEKERNEIMSQRSVPPHLCCSDPSWLYHIYQDTSVDTQEVASLVTSAVGEATLVSGSGDSMRLHPSKVKSVTCVLDCQQGISGSIKENSKENVVNSDSACSVTVTWTRPFTLKFVPEKLPLYEILMQDRFQTDKTYSWSTENTYLTRNVDDASSELYVWVRASFHADMSGPYSDALLCQS